MAERTSDVVVEKFIKATPERVYAALTRGNELQRWFFTDCTTDPREGGEYRCTWLSAKDASRDHARFGKYLELVPNRKVVFEWRGEGSGEFSLKDVGETVVTVTLTPRDGGTMVKLVHSGWAATDAAREMRDSHQGGWSFYVGNLGSYLEGGADQRAEVLGQRVR